MPDSLYNEIAGSTIFRVNSTHLRQNDPWLREVCDLVLPSAKAAGYQLVGIDLRGAASPEGPYENNVRLSKGRAQALRKALSECIDEQGDSAWTIHATAEDYQRLLWLMKKRDDPEAGMLETIIQHAGPQNAPVIKDKLRRLNGGITWRRLLRDYFPELRAARVVLYMRAPIRRVIVADDTPYERLVPVETWSTDELVLSNQVLETADKASVGVSLAKGPRKHMLSISTNLLEDAFYMPNFGWAPMWNVGVEYYPKNSRWTVKAQFMSPYYHRWSKNKFFQIRDYHLEVRRYFRPGWWHTGGYVAAYVNGTKYGIGLSKTKGWQGEGGGAAVKLGYVVPLGKGTWRLDMYIAAGGWYSRYDPYVYGNPITGEENGDYYYDWTGTRLEFKKRNHKFTWFGPTEIGVALTFDVLYHKRNSL